MKTYIIKTGKKDSEVLCYFSGYGMLPAELYLFTKKQAEWMVELFSHIGLKFTLTPYTKKYKKFSKFHLRGCDTPWDHFSDEEFREWFDTEFIMGMVRLSQKQEQVKK